MPRLAWGKFHFGDWLNDVQLRQCSAATRGIWIDMLAIMHQSDPRGYLKAGPVVIHKDNLWRNLGEHPEVVQEAIGELEKYNIFSVDEHGCIFCRRMVRDEEIREKRAAGGKLGGNPALMRDRSSPKVNLRGSPKDKPESESESESEKKEECAEAPRTAASAPPALEPKPGEVEPASSGSLPTPSPGIRQDPDILVWIPAKKGKRPPPPGFPVRVNGSGHEIGVSREVISDYAKDFEAAPQQVLAEFRKAMRWTKARPQRKKTFSGINAFLTNWMENQGRFSRRQVPGPGPTYLKLE